MNYYFETTHDKDNGFKKIVQDRHHDSLKLQKGKLCIGSGHDNIIIRKLATVLPITSLQLISIHWYGHQSIVPSTETFGIRVIWSTAKWVVLFGEIQCCRTNIRRGALYA